MVKHLEAKDSSTPNSERRPHEESSRMGAEQKLHGQALRLNENTVEDQEHPRPPPTPEPGTSDAPNPQRPHGKALRINENTVEDKESAD
jgi:hypothetical protein